MTYDYRYTKKWRLDASRGIKRYTDATPAREHITNLLATGASNRAIAGAAGISPTAITQLTEHGQRQVRTITAARILAVRPEHTHNRPTPDGFVPNIGTRRRIQALQVLGHSARDIGNAAGVTQAVVHNLINQAGTWVSARNRDAILTAYATLWNQRGTSRKTATMAAHKGWAPPLAWDDESIDDPAATPQHQAVAAAPVLDDSAIDRRANGDHDVPLTRAERHAVVARLHAAGLNDGQIERRAGINDRQVLRDRQTLGLPANQPRTTKQGEAA